MKLESPDFLTLTNAMKPTSILRFLKPTLAALFVTLFSGAAMAVPEIGVASLPENTSLSTAGPAVSVGTVDLGTATGTVDKSFRISNTGTTVLTLSGTPRVAVSGADASQFSVTVQPSATVAAAGTSDFTVRFAPTSEGTKTAILSIANDDGDENPFVINLTATATAPEITVDLLTPATSDVTSASFPDVDLGVNPAGTSTRNFRIRNLGDSNLTVSLSGLTGTSFSVTSAPTSPIAAGGTSDFTVTFAPTSGGDKTATLQIANNDPDGAENPYSIALSGHAFAPEIGVAQGGTSIGDGGSYSFGTVTAGSIVARTFDITNTGDSNLTGMSVTLDGANASMFKITAQPNATASGGGGTTRFTIEFNPTGSGTVTAALHISSNDLDENPYDINLSGTVNPPPSGSDTFGYRYVTTPLNTIKLSTADADVFTAGNLVGDDTAQSISLGFNFFFYNKSYSSVTASSNGLLTFEQPDTISGARSYSPHAFPNPATPNNCIAPYWTDLILGANSKILYATRGQVGNRVFIIDYQDLEQYANGASPAESISFQVLLYEGTNEIEFQYKSKSGFDDARGRSIGIEDSLGGVGISVPAPGFPSAIKFARPVFYTVESKYLPPGSPPPLSLSGCQTTDGSTTVTCLDTSALVAGMSISGANIPARTTITGIVSGTVFTISNAATRSSVDLTLTASMAVDVGLMDPSVLNPRIGTGRSTYNTVQRFEAPEFIYLDSAFRELSEAGDVNAPPSNKAWYRLKNDGYAVDGQVVQGTQLFFNHTLDHDVTVVWRWKMQFAVFVDAASGQQGGFGGPVPDVGRHWYDLGQQFTASIDTNVEDLAGGIRTHTTGYTLLDKNDAVVGSPVVFPSDSAARRAISPVSISQPLRLQWQQEGEARYRFDAFSSDRPGASFDGHSFVRVFQETNRSAPDGTNFPPNGIVYGLGANKVVWIPLGRKVEVGAFYQSSDGTLSLNGFIGAPGGDLSGVTSTSDHLEDFPSFPAPPGSTSRVARVYTVRSVTSPTDIHWNYQTTTYRAEIPLGESLKVEADGRVLNGQLTPALPANARLNVAGAGPGNSIITKRGPADGSTNKLGDPLRWDAPGRALFPVHPGVYEITWPDGTDSTKTYRVEVLTGYPGDTVTRTFASEASNGTRVLSGTLTLNSCATTDGSATVTCASTTGLAVGMRVRGNNIPTGATVASVVNATSFLLSEPANATATGLTLTAWRTYLNTVTLPEVDPNAGYPGQPFNAHYRHLFDTDATRQAPTKLDLSNTDEWKFLDLVFADAATGASALKSAPGVPFSATGSGRSVLLYSYRPNPDEIADGTLSQERLAVRVVRSSPLSIIPRTDPKLVLGQRGLQLGSGAPSAGGVFGIVGTGAAVQPGTQFAMDFWLNAKNAQATGAVTLANCVTNGTTTVTCASTAGLRAGMSISGPRIAPGTKVASITNGTAFVLSASAASSAGQPPFTLTASYSSVALTNCTTTLGAVEVTCDSTADLVAGMTIGGANIVPGATIEAITDGTHFTMSTAATGSGAGLSLTASNKPVTIFRSGSGGLKVTFDPLASTLTVDYRGISATHALPRKGAAWRHYVIHVFEKKVFQIPVTVLDFYADGVREEQALPTASLQGNADSAVGATIGADSFRIGVDADPLSGIQIDQLRLFKFAAFPTDNAGYLTASEVRQLKTLRDMTVTPTVISSITDGTHFVMSRAATASGSGLTLRSGALTLTNCTTIAGSTTVTCDSTAGLSANAQITGPNVVAGTLLRGYSPSLWFSFENSPATGGVFANQGTAAGVGIGPVSGTAPFTGTWVNVDLQEVATRIASTLDNAGFGGSGYIRNAVSNYNAALYNRAAEVGEWGPIFPVNHNQLFSDSLKRLEVVYYENPYKLDRVPHPNVAWPYCATEYKDVVFPTVGPDKDNAIYIASRIGSEGVDQTGRPQRIFDPAVYAGVEVYQQPDVAAAGYNPNEEHALTAPSGRAAVKVKNLGESLANNPPLAVFALQKDINNLPVGTYTSDPWVLVQMNNVQTGEPEMAAYQVFDTRAGTVPFPRPADGQVGGATGLAYEAASTPEARFLTLAPGAKFNFEYKFDYPVFAGDPLVPPYPLNLVIGNVTMADARGGNIQVNGINQRTLWRDAAQHAWVVSGGGRFFYQFFYPMRADFYLPGAVVGTPVAWLPAKHSSQADFIGDNAPGTTTLDDEPKPVKVRYSSAWRSDYPKLKRGETLTYQGGEYFNETPGSEGLPALVAMKAAEIVYDSATPSMVIKEATVAELDKASARIIRPLDRREVNFTSAQMSAAGLKPGDPATSKVIVVAERWYFKELSGSLQKRFYFDSLAEKLVFRGRLNDKESGDPALTQGPDPINTLEPNVLTLAEYTQTAPGKGLYELGTSSDWRTAVNAIFTSSQSPNGVTTPAASTTAPVFTQGVKPVPPAAALTPKQRAQIEEQKLFWKDDLSGTVTAPDPVLMQLDSFGVGAALVPNPSLLTMKPEGSLYITIAENSREELDGAPVSLHIVEIIPDRYRGAIKVHEGADAFSEKITLQHNGEFGANTGDLDYEWWIRDSRELDDTLKSEIESLSTAQPDADWQLYASGPALHTIVFQGRPDVILADKLVLMRYRHASEASRGWNLVPFELPTGTTASAAWKPANVTPFSPAPFQWAGAANSPQLQADGSKRYIPQLVMGWVKRVLDRLNPYEARYTDFFSTESPASYTSQIQIAGAPYAGNVALNPDKSVIENTGLIELYRTVLDRAADLSINNSSNGNSTPGINQALLLAATRLNVLYDLLAREAYSDAQDSTISVPEDSGLTGVAGFTFAFQNLEPDLLREELSLLRGTDFRKSYPVYNRMFWNYAKGLGEAAYNVNYNIYDANRDGFINESDARLLYPQGHGDSWGHFTSALQMHYVLLQNANFSWAARAELYSLLQNVIPVDYLDENTFAKAAAGRARTGRDIVRATYRLNYTHDPDGQWQGYTDGADPARAWGVSEWAHRAGQGAYFDWAIANALLPEQALDENGKPLQNLSEIERSAAVSEIGEIAGVAFEIQTAMDEANFGANPLGLDSDAISFDVDPFYDGVSWERKLFFEEIYDRAVTAGENAAKLLEFATAAENKLNAIGDDTDASIIASLRQDIDYRNRLIEIFGTPYTGQIGFGKAYPEGYQGPDTQLYAYLDKVRIDQIVPPSSSTDTNVVTFSTINTIATGLMNDANLVRFYNSAGLSANIAQDFKTIIGNSLYGPETASGPFTAPYETASKYAFQAPASWGRRTSYGKIQTALEEMLAAEIELDAAIADYIGFLQDFEQKVRNLQSELSVFDKKDGKDTGIVAIRATTNSLITASKTIIGILGLTGRVVNKTKDAIKEAFPTVVGLAADVTSGARAAAELAILGPDTAFETAKNVAEIAYTVAELIRDEVVARFEREKGYADEVATIQGLVAEMEYHTGGDQPKRDAIGLAAHNLEMKRQQYFTALSEGFRLLREREAFNKVLAAATQKDRYKDMIFRLTRNEAMAKYQTAFNIAARYTWLAAKAYDYETSLDPGDPAAPTELFNRIVRERQLGLWSDGPQAGQGGLAEILAQMNGNFSVLKGQLGLTNPQQESEKFSLRSELFRIGPTLEPELREAVDTPVANRTPQQTALINANLDVINAAAASDARFVDVLKARIVPDLTKLREFNRYCRPFSTPEEGPQPGIVIRFSTEINNGVNVFGRALVAGDHKYSTANYATKLRGFGVWLSNYTGESLITSPRAYLVPIGDDYFRTSSTPRPALRVWSVNEQRIPIPYVINQGQITAPGFIPTLDGVDGSFSDVRRHGDFRMYHDDGDPEADESETIYSTRLFGRSVWNSEWMLIIPGAGLSADPMAGITEFSETVSDIKLFFDTYSPQGR